MERQEFELHIGRLASLIEEGNNAYQLEDRFRWLYSSCRGNPAGEAKVLYWHALAHSNDRNWDESLAKLEEAMRLTTKGDELKAKLYLELSGVMYQLRRYTESLANARKAHMMLPPGSQERKAASHVLAWAQYQVNRRDRSYSWWRRLIIFLRGPVYPPAG